MSEYSDEDYTLTETQCEERCDELRSQLDEANKIIESLGQESDHFCKQADELRSQVARLEGELAQARKDTERLDWCDREMIITYPSQRKPGNTLRQTIDEKMLEHKTWVGLQPDAARPAPENGAASNAPAPAGQPMQFERERELSDQLVDVLRRTEGALYECGCESCEATLQKLCAVLTQHAAMRAKESNSKAEQSHPQSNTTPSHS